MIQEKEYFDRDKIRTKLTENSSKDKNNKDIGNSIVQESLKEEKIPNMKVSINKGEIFKLKTKNTEVSTTGVTITNKKELDLLEEQLYDLLNDKARVEYYKN